MIFLNHYHRKLPAQLRPQGTANRGQRWLREGDQELDFLQFQESCWVHIWDLEQELRFKCERQLEPPPEENTCSRVL